eukprot:GHVL01036833.1.p1 GENE.GHVL01036833.1~~GHVL01036833.1.p1  ORF type:complete len:254 (-),score=48.30 GHVL01036833.1:351-1037(-)
MTYDSESVALDIEEWTKLLNQSNRETVKNVIKQQIELLNNKKIKSAPTLIGKVAHNVEEHPKFFKIIQKFSWNQEGDKIKVYIDLPGVHTVPAANIKFTAEEKSFDFKVEGLDGKDYRLNMPNTAHSIKPKDCTYRVKNNAVSITLVKADSSNWADLSAKSTVGNIGLGSKKGDKPEDVQDSLMTMMKQLYTDGDDEMKKTIAKSWTEARNNRNSPGGGMGISPDFDI